MELTIPTARGSGTSGDEIAFERRAAPTAAIRVLLAHAEPLARAGVRALLESQDDVSVVGEASRGQDVVVAAAESTPDVVLMDIRLLGLDALESTRRIVGAPDGARTKVVILGSSGNDEEFFRALHAGAIGFLVQETTPPELLQAIRSVAEGHALLSPSVTRRLIEEFASQPDRHRPVPERLEELTAREREVMGLVAMGLTNDEIGARLVVSPATAKTHVSRAMMKLHARDRAQLVALAYQSRLVDPRRTSAEAPRPVLVAA